MLAYTPTGSHFLRSPLPSPSARLAASPPPPYNHQPLPGKRTSSSYRSRDGRSSPHLRYAVNALLAALLFVMLYFSFAKSFKQVAHTQLPPSIELHNAVPATSLQSKPVPGGLEEEWRWAANVSFVYTWVNGSEAVYAAKRVKAGGKLGGERDRDTGDLRFSLRSLEKYAPWHTGTVYLVSPAGHIPDWLDSSNPRFVHVDQDSLVPKEDQPTFNSNCIEQFFHLIPGLTERFVVFNDDYFLKKPTHPRVFFTPNRGLRFYPEPGTLGIARTRPVVGSTLWTTSVRLTASVIEEAYPTYHESYETRITEHAPFVYSKEGFKGAHNRFNSRLRETCANPFRDEADVLWPLIFQAYTVFEGSRCCDMKYSFDLGKATFLRWTQNKRDNDHRWHDAQSRDVYFFNVNDDMRTGPGALSATEQLIQKLEAAYSIPSSFEKPSIVEPSHEAGFARSDKKIMDPALR